MDKNLMVTVVCALVVVAGLLMVGFGLGMGYATGWAL